MALIDTVKAALRISHDKLDDEISRLITTAKDDLIRVGVPSGIAADEGDSLVTQAVVTFVLMTMTEDATLMDKYQRAYEIQADGLRRRSDV